MYIVLLRSLERKDVLIGNTDLTEIKSMCEELCADVWEIRSRFMHVWSLTVYPTNDWSDTHLLSITRQRICLLFYTLPLGHFYVRLRNGDVIWLIRFMVSFQSKLPSSQQVTVGRQRGCHWIGWESNRFVTSNADAAAQPEDKNL